jgi:hypothetical protein
MSSRCCCESVAQLNLVSFRNTFRFDDSCRIVLSRMYGIVCAVDQIFFIKTRYIELISDFPIRLSRLQLQTPQLDKKVRKQRTYIKNYIFNYLSNLKISKKAVCIFLDSTSSTKQKINKSNSVQKLTRDFLARKIPQERIFHCRHTFGRHF